MRPASCTHVLLDFFGTLVHYNPSRTAQGYPRSHALVRSFGADLSYARFLGTWSATSRRFDQRSAGNHREYSMSEVAAAFLTEVLGREPAAEQTADLVAAYLREWNTGVRYPAGVGELVAELAGSYRLAVVSNTHQADLVLDHLAAMGILPRLDTVVTSVQVGWRKPHPAIYATALSRLGVAAPAAVFVGDDYVLDYAGPRRAGIRSYLIDPDARHAVADGHRLSSIFDLLDVLV